MLLALPSRNFARRVLAPFAVLLATAAALFAQTPSAADGFEANVDGNVYAVATQPDGRLLVAGQFTSFRQVDGAVFSRNNLARLNPDGTVDASFDPSPNGPVRALAQQPDGLIVIGGDFTSLRPNGGATVDRGRIARLRADGTPDSLQLNIGGAPLPGGGTLAARVHALLVQPDGSLVVGGDFGSVQPGVLVIFTRRNIFRVSASGAIDANFNPSASSIVLALAPHVEGKILVGGGFTSFQPGSATSPTTRNRIARLNADGTLDSQFNPNANNAVTSLLVQRDGKIVLGGNFSTLQPVGNDTAANRNSIARLNVDGTLDSEFFPNTNGSVAGLALQPDGAILVGGSFNVVWGRGTASATRLNAARFNPDGTLDGGFNPGLNAQVNAFAFQADGKIVLGGHFTRAQPGGGTVAFTRNRLARLNSDGSLDATFELQAGGRVLATAVQADGRIVIGGSFTSAGGATHNFLARLNADGSVDPTYNPDLNGRVYTIALEPGSGKMIIGGAFTTIGGESRNHIARLNPSGAIDSEFNPNIDGEVGAIVVQSDGRILVGGTFATVRPIGAAAVAFRSNLLRLNANGTLDTTFDPGPNSSVSALAVQGDGKILVGGSFSALSPNAGANVTSRNFVARINSDGTVDTTFSPALSARVSAIVVQPSDQKIILTGAFTSVLPTNATAGVGRNYILRLNADGTLDTPYNPNANAPVLAAALQSDGKLVIGGSFTTLQPGTEPNWTLRKYAARLNTDGTIDTAFNLDIDEAGGNRVDSVRVFADGRILLGGQFASLHPAGTAQRITRRTLARINANGTVDTTFNPGAGGATSGLVNAFAVQRDNKVIAVGSFSDLGGAKSTNIARFNAEGTADNTFSPSLTTDGAVNAVVLRPSVTATPTQLGGFAWLNRDGSLRSGFTGSSDARLSGTVNTAAVQADGRLLLGGAFTNLSNATGGNLARFSAAGVLDTSFNPNPNGAVTGIVVQNDGRIVIVGTFTVVNGVVRNRIARLNADGSLDSTFDPNASARINAIVLESDGKFIVGGAFTSFTPNGAAAAVNRTYLARLNADGTVDANYNPTPNSTVNALALQADGKVVAGGAFSAVQPNSTATATTRQGIARFNTDGTVDQNFNPNPNAPVNAIVALPNGQFVIGGSFTSLQPNATGTIFTRNNIARINSDGAVDDSFNPNPNGAVTVLALQPDGSVVLAGDFTTLQPGATGSAVTRNGLVRLLPTGALDVGFNPDVNGDVAGIVARPDGTLLVTGNFTGLQTTGAIVVGGSFQTIGGIAARNLATLNVDGSVNTTFQPNPNGAIHALLVQADGRLVVGGAFTTIAGATRNGIARFNANGTLDTAFNPTLPLSSVLALGVQPDGKLLVGGGSAISVSIPGGTTPPTNSGLVRVNADGSIDATFNAPQDPVRVILVQPDGRILIETTFFAGRATQSVRRLNADGTLDSTFNAPFQSGSTGTRLLALQADGRVIAGAVAGGAPTPRVYVLRSDGSLETSIDATALAAALQSDGRLMIGAAFTSVGGLPRFGIARLSPTGAAVQTLGVSADRRTATWLRSGSTGEIAVALFELSTDRVNWTPLGVGTRVAGTSNWQVTGLSLPASGVFYVRARGIAPSSGGGSSGVYETVREFNYTSPVGGTTSTATNVIAAAAVSSAAVWTVDDVTGVATLTAMQLVGSGGAPSTSTIEILVPNTSAAAAGATSRLVNLSTRSRVTAGSPLVVGFAVAGTESRAILVRGIGPTLGVFGVTDAIAATRLQVLDSAGRVVVTTEGWDAANSGNLIPTFAQTGAFPLPGRSGDSAAVLTLAPGTYTLQVGPAASAAAGGVALAEVYDAGGSGAASRLLNVSTRGDAAAGGNALISGFVIAGQASKRVLLRGAGPSLTKFGVTGVLADPALALFNAQGRELGANDNWVAGAAPLAAASLSVGAFALDAGSKDAAVLATLPPGAYTVQVTPTGATPGGTALLEIYEIP